MNITEISTSRKLEYFVPEELIQNEYSGKFNPLGKWKGTLFFVNRNKCLLITNTLTRYSVMIGGIRKREFKNLSEIFINNFIEQLKIDGIESVELDIRNLIGEITLHPTDRDRAIAGTQKYILENIDAWKQEFGAFENWNFREINRRINGVPYKQLGWLFPREMMKILLEEVVIY